MMSNTSSIDDCKPWLMEKTFALTTDKEPVKKINNSAISSRVFEFCVDSFITLNNRVNTPAHEEMDFLQFKFSSLYD